MTPSTVPSLPLASASSGIRDMLRSAPAIFPHRGIEVRTLFLVASTTPSRERRGSRFLDVDHWPPQRASASMIDPQ